MGQVNEISNEFKKWLFEEGRAEKTIASYVGDVVGLQRYLT
jgi:integrase/recombinase XerD